MQRGPSTKKVTLHQFIERSKFYHEDKYDYSLISEFKGTYSKVQIVCPIHGIFEQVVKNHITGSGCQKCANKTKGDSRKFKWSEGDVLFLISDYSANRNINKLSKHFNIDRDVIRKKLIDLDLYIRTKPHEKIFQDYKLISGTYWYGVVNGAKNRNIDFLITQDYVWKLFLKQDKKCALSGWEIEFSKDLSLNTVSIDRIDSSKGYTNENIQLVHPDINLLKFNWNEKYLYRMCEAILKNRPDLNCKELQWVDDIWLDTSYPVMKNKIIVNRKFVRQAEKLKTNNE